ncbi:MAG: fluoride efflux transporter CrcB [Anaerolineales bacterium]
MGNLVLIGVGGFLGAVARYWLSGRVQDLSGAIGFPYGTLAVNILGCFALGVLSYLIDTRGLLGPESRALMIVGILGAFTTFSTFSMETLNLLLDGELVRALINIFASTLLGLAAVWAGRSLLFLIWR